jgi:TolB-like protein/DNA-binding winged helix-turn-helix (wHTH) protein
MSSSLHNGNRVRFGVFELDLEAGELRKNGLKVRLQDQPYQLLALLVERSGQLVSREEICQQLWPNGTFVEFDGSLHVAVNKIREALGDSASSPRFLETVPRRGYRFIAPVEKTPAGRAAARAVSLENPAARWRAAVVIGCAALLAVGMLYLRGGSADPIKSIAVLPFTNATPAADTQYLSDGITEGIINNLSAVPRLKVIARTTVFRFKGKEVEPQEVGRQLGVDAILTGRISHASNSVMAQIDLINVSDGSQLWGERFKSNIAELQSLQGDMAREIAEKLRLKLAGEESQRLTRRYTANSEAYQLYLKAIYSTPGIPLYWLKGIQNRVDHLQQAIAKDPSFARAYVELAKSYHVGVMARFWPAPKELEKQKDAARRALELDDGLGEAHVALANALWLEWDWAGADREFKRGTELNASSAHMHFGRFLAQTGRTQEAIVEAQRAIELDPLSPETLTNVAFIYVMTRRYDQALECARRASEGRPAGAVFHAFLGKEQYQDAIAEYERAIAEDRRILENVGGRGHLARAYVKLGRLAEAHQILSELQVQVEKDALGAYEVAFLYGALGNKDEAFRWLDKAYEQRDPGLMYLKVDPTMDPLRSDPRFRALVRRVGLPQ